MVRSPVHQEAACYRVPFDTLRIRAERDPRISRMIANNNESILGAWLPRCRGVRREVVGRGRLCRILRMGVGFDTIGPGVESIPRGQAASPRDVPGIAPGCSDARFDWYLEGRACHDRPPRGQRAAGHPPVGDDPPRADARQRSARRSPRSASCRSRRRTSSGWRS